MRRVIYLLFMMLSASAIASQDQPSLSRAVYGALQDIQQQIQHEQYDKASRGLTKLQQSKLSAYEKQQVWQLLANLRYRRGDVAGALKAYEVLIGLPDLSDKMKTSLLLQTAQLRFRLGRYKACNQALSAYLRMELKPADKILLLHAQAFYHREAYASAEAPLRRVIARARQRGAPPAENVLLLMQATLHQQKKTKAMLPIVKQLVKHYPSKDHVLRLAGVLSVLGRTREQLVVMTGLYERGELTQAAQLRNLVNLHLLHDTPRAAAEVLDKAIKKGILADSVKNRRLLAQAWRAAKDLRRAVPSLRRVARLTGAPSTYLELGYLHSELREWPEAVSALKSAAKRGSSKQRSRAELMLGIALFHLRDYPQAQQAFASASQHEEWAQRAAQWMQYIEQVALAPSEPSAGTELRTSVN